MNDKFFDSSWYEEGNVQPLAAWCPERLWLFGLQQPTGLLGN